MIALAVHCSMLSLGRGRSVADEVIADALFVDLDGTLVATDVLREALVLACKRKPWVVASFFFYLFRGRAAAKRVVAKRIAPEPSRLPFRDDVIHFISEARAGGCRVVLATASDAVWAEPIARHVGCFDDVLASDGQRNLKGVGKLEAIQSYCQQHRCSTFAYVGDAMADMPIWEQAAQVYVVAPTPHLLDVLHRRCPPTRVFN